MAASHSSPGAMLLRLWQRLAPLPGGRWLFSRLLGRYVPYTGSIRPQIQELRPGYGRVGLRDCRRVRNHLNSVHAIALANLGEVTSGLAVLTGLSPHTRGIVLRLSMEYMKKARGPLMAESTCAVPEVCDVEQEFLVTAEICDSEGDIVARATVCWRLGPV
jgi:acyl-coenzyme A thioesterase PaaI-like protein